MSTQNILSSRTSYRLRRHFFTKMLSFTHCVAPLLQTGPAYAGLRFGIRHAAFRKHVRPGQHLIVLCPQVSSNPISLRNGRLRTFDLILQIGQRLFVSRISSLSSSLSQVLSPRIVLQTTLHEIAMYHMMREDAVEKANNRALKKLQVSYPGSKMQWWNTIHRTLGRM